MNHWWLRMRKGFARNQIIYECSHCLTRKRPVGAGPRGGRRWAVKVPGDSQYRLLRRVPPCYEVKTHAF